MLLYQSMIKSKKPKIVILQMGDPILREVSSPVPVSKIKTAEIKNLISDLGDAILSQSDAAAISAIQIGKPVRLFIISKRVFGFDSDASKDKKNKEDLIFINPKIVKVSKAKKTLEEGCLYVRYVYGKVTRPEKVTLEALDQNGKKFSRGFSGLLAQIVQHENDHLNGILFTDKATDLQEISHEEYDEMLKNSK